MAFEPKPGDQIKVANELIEFLPLEDSVFIYAESGKEGTIYKVLKGTEYYALKVFYPEYRDDRLLKNTEKLSSFKKFTGFRVAERTVINRALHKDLIKEFPELNYSILMPWIQGTVWGNMTSGGHPLKKDKYYKIASLFLGAVSSLESQGMAHCDLSNNNFIIDPKLNSVELIDIENMYAPGMPRPIPDISYGTPGYRTKYIAENGLWGASSDRFAAAILSAEIFTWHNLEIRNSKAGDTSYFDEAEIGQDCDRYRLMRYFLNYESAYLAELFEKAWFAKYLDQCPPIADWMNAVEKSEDLVKQNNRPNKNDEEVFVSNSKIPQNLFEGNQPTKDHVVINGMPPKMRVDQELLDFGELKDVGNELPIIIENVGGSLLEGVITCAEWLKPSQKSFSIRVGDKRKITIAIEKNAPKPRGGFEQRIPNALIIESNAGVEVVGARYQLAKPFLFKLWFSLLMIVIVLSSSIWYVATSDDRLLNRAEQNFLNGNINAAVDQLNLFIERYPKKKVLAQETYLSWSKQLSDNGEYEESNSILLEAENLLGGNNDFQSLYQRNYLELAKNEYRNNDLDRGIIYLNKAKKHDPKNQNNDINSLYDDFYIAYAKKYYLNKKYEESVVFLEKVSSDGFKSKNDEVLKLYQEIYLSWVDALVKSKDFKEGLNVLDGSKKYFVSQQDISQWNDKNTSLNISWANSLSSSGKFREAIERINQSKKYNLNNQQINKIDQAGASILRNFSNSTGSQATEEIKNLVKGICGTQHSFKALYPIFSVNLTIKNYVIYNLTSQKTSHLITPSSIYYVACVTDKKPVLVENCSYEGGYSILRYRRSWEVALYNILNGEKIGGSQLSGGTPSACKYSELFTVGKYENERYTESASDDLVLNEWIKQFVNR